jgi:predicted nucleic acid-binding protein
MGDYLIDTNAVSDYLSASLPEAGMAFMDTVIDGQYQLSVISEIELRSWRTDRSTEMRVSDFIEDGRVLSITPDVIRDCVQLRRQRRMKTPDAIIAATALANRYILITANTKDFAGINGLTLINPHQVESGDQ